MALKIYDTYYGMLEMQMKPLGYSTYYSSNNNFHNTLTIIYRDVNANKCGWNFKVDFNTGSLTKGLWT